MRRSLTKKHIIRKKTEIDRIFKQGEVSSCRGMRLITIRNDFNFDRFIVIPAKKYGNSIERNKIRRKMKENFRLYSKRKIYSNYETLKGLDIALVVYPGKNLNNSELKSNFYILLDKKY